MPGSSNSSSFIPKRGTKKSTRKVRNFNVYILTIVSYVLFFGALGAAAFAFFYQQSYNNKLNEEVAAMSAAVADFKEADMQRVEEFDVRLRQANQRLNNTASVVAILTAIESATVDSVRFSQLTLQRNLDEDFVVEVSAETDTYDSAIFQRDVIEGYDVVEAVEIQDASLQQAAGENVQTVGQILELTAFLSIPLEAVPYEVSESESGTPETPAAPDTIPVETTESVEADAETGDGQAAEAADDNQTDI